MTNDNSSLSTGSSEPAISVSHQPQAESVAQQPQVTEKSVPQSQVDKIAGTRHKEGYDKGYREAQETFSRQQAVNTQPTAPVGSTHVSPAQIDPHVLEQIATPLVSRVLEQKAQEYQMRLAAQQQQKEDEVLTASLVPKIEAAKQKIPDYSEKVSQFEAFSHQSDPSISRAWFNAFNTVDNAGEVMYDVLENPNKYATLKTLIENPNTRRMAISQIAQLSQSLKNNETAKQAKTPRDPIGQIQPSQVGKGNGDEVDHFGASRSKYRF